MIDALHERQRRQMQRRDAALTALPALDRLVAVMQHKTGQGHKLRAFLYSMWNGEPVSLLDALSLDWPIRQDVALVWLGFGHDKAPSFFYDDLKKSVTAAGLWPWFIEEAKVQS